MTNHNEFGAGFVAGTLVHTKDGLRPIEQIRVGDYVLSKPESGKGELAYKPVTRTFVHEDASNIHMVVFNKVVEREGKREVVQSDWILVTGNHPFYSKDEGWTQASNLGSGVEVQMMDGDYATTYGGTPIYQTSEPDIGWCTPYDDVEEVMRKGLSAGLVEFRVDGFAYKPAKQVRVELPDGYPKLTRTVYNIEVQDNHTYYVGRLGIWAHNKDERLRVLSKTEADLVDGSQSGQSFIKLEEVRK